jgi:3-methylcrotonyl-CoA carboxylase alpha subunit
MTARRPASRAHRSADTKAPARSAARSPAKASPALDRARVLVANRGEIACRVLHTLRALGVPGIAVYTDADREAPHRWLADEAHALGANDGYLDPERLLAAARETSATAIHPGYGFLSQNAAFAQAVADSGLVFVGPSPAAMRALGEKRSARATAERAGVPVIPGAAECNTVAIATEAARRIGYPVLLKAAGGGGGKGMRRVVGAGEMATAFAAAQREARAAFADDRLLIEKLIHPARHVEVQILGDGRDAIALGERECSLQRRYQKVIEESPSPGISDGTRRALGEAAVALARGAKYANAGTVEFLVGPDEEFAFLEVNTRLQVEHPVTELRFGIDLVRVQLEVAYGAPLPSPPPPRGHAIEARIYAEDPAREFLPASGRILHLEWPHRPGVRIDTGVAEGQDVTPFFDPLLAKVIAWGEDREEARQRLIAALADTVLLGLATNQSFLLDILASDFFVRGETHTTTLEGWSWAPEPAPPALVEAVRKALRTGPANGGQGSGAPRDGLGPGRDLFSPWRSLGPFRIGGEATDPSTDPRGSR